MTPAARRGLLAPLPLVLASCAGAPASALGALLAATVAVVAAVAARRRWPGPPASATLAVEARAPLGREAGVALLRVRGRLLLVGWGPGGVRLVARLGSEHAP